MELFGTLKGVIESLGYARDVDAFLIIDMVVANVLLSMGMHMLSPV